MITKINQFKIEKIEGKIDEADYRTILFNSNRFRVILDLECDNKMAARIARMIQDGKESAAKKQA